MSGSIRLSKPTTTLTLDVPLTSSKSESNRALLLNELGGGKSELKNLSSARDTVTMTRLLDINEHTLDVLDAGTVMRFMTAYLAMGKTERKITGTPRMCQRPIKLLVDALNDLGANITYEKEIGFPPLLFKPFSQQKTNQLTIPGNISSQYISALLMIAPTLPEGLTITLEGDIYSRPYIEMTLNLMKHFGVSGQFEGHTITVAPQNYKSNSYTIESDWSGASYWYSLFALAEDAKITLKGLREISNQGDHAIASIMEGLGVKSTFDGETVTLSRGDILKEMTIDFKSCPDLAQTVMACAAALGVNLKMTGLESLRIKESDRTAAMATELAKIGATLEEHENGLWVLTSPDKPQVSGLISFDTYDDHRMAMALAPLSMKFDCEIHEPEVVVKSYPEYWDHLEMAGVKILK
ncbi:3-phosphoshikimate 1-carboxyvinyltransferase [Reichenbachiella carrageenanivorans]|uniref:3-phosphoshikimate 1-carboxyvinyltransferase n=1 Tax=Reichenbachiella carrageenanivorans TaxID=2979869 RepID=A0ABY6D5U2_9BACT|nr:3-phosphoshikimate 1-carboxyvinyltransferase [Reichenbachiella carrageenanivorans]UXX79220.1 3-phosphoshikimate 1-carboxyvinyltransferase [Reichenbachiella carrageenanivorans]